MKRAYPRNDSELLSRSRQPADAPRGLTLQPPMLGYTCSACSSAWQYQDVRNTGRCPSCGSGLLRDAGRH